MGIAVWILGLLFHSTLPGLILAIAGFTAINGLLMYWCYSLLDRAENRRQKAAAWGTMLLYLILLLLPSVIAVSMLARSYGAANM